MELLSCSVIAFVLALIGKSHSKAPPPNFKNPYEKQENKSMDQLITGMLGGIDIANNMILGDAGKILAELDMYLSEGQFLSMYQPPKAAEMVNMGMMPAPVGVQMDENYFFSDEYGIRSKRKAIREETLRWTNAEIPYLFAQGHFTKGEEYMMRRAMTEWERYTCMKFRPATTSDKNSVRFQGGVGCNSMLGMYGGVQILNLQSPGCRFKGLYLHEIGHAIGLVHEHQLPDRDNYISILYHNVEPHMRIWFNKYSTAEVNQMRVPYEYSSVMHYGVTAFSIGDERQTIQAHDRSKEESIGKVYLKELAYTDVYIVNLMYNCSGHCPDQNKCGSDGHLDQNCNCICRDGSSDCDRTKQVKNDATCVNTYDSWACYIWANQGECERNPLYMSTYCTKACGKCGPEAQAQGKNSIMWPWQWFPSFANIIPKKWRALGSICKDVYRPEKCSVWRQRGDCVTNAGWMTKHCKATCGACGDVTKKPEVACNDTFAEAHKCVGWAREGECVVNSAWMFKNCKKSCAMCTETEVDGGGTETGVDEDKMDCVDNEDKCADWASRNECLENPAYMIINCRKSCKKCDDGTCKNLYDDSQCKIWAEKQECMLNEKWMAKHCAKSCGRGLCEGKTPEPTTATVTGAGTRRTTSPTTVDGRCTNKHTSDTECEIWAKSDHCNINPRWMSKNCAAACNACGGGTTKGTTPIDPDTKVTTVGCEDKDKGCAGWAKHGFCDSNPRYNLVYCKKSCNSCNGCRDAEFLCSVWAKDGHCLKNPSYMLRHCQKSCTSCQASADTEMLKPEENATTKTMTSFLLVLFTFLLAL
ncbi:zinc metalloproteinase nas-15-like isoform X2 [Physella acuta]|uniref:zinc metalloproteinase nas-15-like isoform X2 n=1 Tax=Physella acuta TaxID=109671 RepID=UPI0027DE90E6|nr:zinc metalloproteinase nas-15-like isoform X2 [Physella acuta]